MFTKKVYLRKVPKAKETAKAFKSMINEAKSSPKSVYIDKGAEFRGAFEAFCKQQNIKIIRAVKLAPVVERMNRSVKELLQKYKEAYKHNVSDYVQDVADNINSRISRPIKKTPDQATKEYEDNDVAAIRQTYKTLHKYLGNNTDARDIRVGHKVRVLKFRKDPLAKGYLASWTKQSFRVLKHSANGVYTLDKPGNDQKYNANYIKRVTGKEPPPPKKVKPGGMLDRLRKARKKERKDYSDRVEPRARRARRKQPVRYRAGAARQRAVQRKQKYPAGTRVTKRFEDGNVYGGLVVGFDKSTGWYRIEYEDGDEEEMNEREVKKHLVKR